MKIGIYPGTFDPVHNGHIGFAQAAMRDCGLDKIIFLPEHTPRDKTGVTAFKHRMAMLRHAVRPFVHIEVMDLDEPQFTIAESLPKLQAILQGAELTILLGSDVVKTFAYRWPALHELLLSCSIAVGLRAGDTPQQINDFLDSLQVSLGVPITATCVQSHIDYATSSDVRSKVQMLGPNEISPVVSNYIVVHNLYLQGTSN